MMAIEKLFFGDDHPKYLLCLRHRTKHNNVQHANKILIRQKSIIYYTCMSGRINFQGNSVVFLNDSHKKKVPNKKYPIKKLYL